MDCEEVERGCASPEIQIKQDGGKGHRRARLRLGRAVELDDEDTIVGYRYRRRMHAPRWTC